MLMARAFANLAAKLDAVAQNCEPQGFLQLVLTAKDFISAASLLSDIRDESEFLQAFSRFLILMFRFHSAFQQAYDMNLLVDVDDTTQSAPRDLRALDKALATAHRRVECVAIVCRSAEAAACLIGIRRFPNLFLPWTQMFALVMDRPIFAAVFRDVDLGRWNRTYAELETRSAALAERSGFRRINLRGTCYALTFEAGALWVDALTHRADKDKLVECASRMRRLLNFLTLPAQERWILQEFVSIGSTDSIQAVLKEILRYDLRPAQPVDTFNQELLEQGLAVEGEPLSSLVLTEGWFRKRKYLVSAPGLPYFVERLSQVALENATGNTIPFLRTHYRGVSQSVAVKAHKQHLLRIENAITDARFKDTMQHLSAHLAGEVFAFAVTNYVGASAEASIFIAGCFGAVVEVMMRLKED